MPQSFTRRYTNADLKKPKPVDYDTSGFTADSEVGPNGPQDFDASGFTPDSVGPVNTNKKIAYTGPADREPVQGPEDRTTGEDIWNEVNRPHSNNLFSKGAKALGDLIPGANTSNPHLGYARGAAQGMLQGAGSLLDNFTSDLGIGALAGGLGEYAGLAKVAPEVLEGLHTASKVAGAPFAVSGAKKVLDPKLPWSERLQGIPEMAGGIAPLLHVPEVGTGQHSPINPADTMTKAFQTRMPLEGSYFDKTHPYQGQGALDFPSDNNLPVGPNAGDPIHQQPGLDFGSKPTPNRGQVPFDFSNEGPKTEPVQQGLDLVGMPLNMPHEFSPDGTFMNRPATNEGAPRSLFDKSPEQPPLDSTAGMGNHLSAFQKAMGDSFTGKEAESPKKSVFFGNDEEFAKDQLSDNPSIIDDQGKIGWEAEPDQHGYTGESTPQLEEFHRQLRESLDRDKQQFGDNSDEQGPLFSRSEKGGVKIGVDVKHAAGELTTGYSRALPAIMVREAIQNAKDAIGHLGDNGKIDFSNDDNGFTVEDNGKGMNRQELETVFSDLHSSGKADDPNATGGKGIGKATYMLGGKHFKVESVKEINGKKVLTSMEGTPDEFMDHVDIHEENVPDNTPTGTRIQTQFTDEQKAASAAYEARQMARDIRNHSRDLPGKITHEYYPDKSEPFSQSAGDTTIGTTNIDGTKFTVNTPKGSVPEQTSYIRAHVLNNGMYQYTKEIYLGDNIPEMPPEIIINAEPKAKEGTPEYPFPTQRESLKEQVDKQLSEFLDNVLVNPQKQRKASTLNELYASMTSKNTGGVRNSIVFDPGNRLTPQERNIVEGNQVTQQVNKFFDRVVDEALKAAGNQKWQDKLEGTGIMFAEPGFYGVHVPNPQTGKSSIMVNLLEHVRTSPDPESAAWGTVSTLFHELGHIGERAWGTPATGKLTLTPEEASDPRLGKFMNMYLENVEHGGATTNQGHGSDWLARTADVMTKYGPSKTIGAVDELTKILSDKSGGYNGQTKSLLQIASERAGRPETTPDYLSPTGIKSKSTEGGEGDTTGGTNADSVGTTSKRPVRPVSIGKKLTADFNKPITQEQVKQVQQQVPQQEIPQRIANVAEHLKQAKDSPEITTDEKESLIEKGLNFQRTLLTSYDLSAPGRQGLPLIGRKEWWTSWKPMLESYGSEKAYNAVMQSIRDDPSGLFSGEKSFANEAGLELTDTLSHREELFRSKWAEDYVPGVKPSVRAYTAYLNKLRADSFKNMVKEAGAENNMVESRKIADFINVATGRGSLGAFEPAAKPLAQIFFSPRLTASRLQMYTRTFNPYFYGDMPPVVRQNQLRSALALAGTGMLMGQLSKFAGATVNTDPTNTDFGKIRFGKTRIDPFAGHQQFLVAAARLASGKTTSSTSNKSQSLTTGKFGKPTRADVVGNFMKNKLAPIPSFVWSWMEGKDFDGTPFNAKQEMFNRTVPIVMQDLHDIWKENPALLPGLTATFSSIGGAGVQTYGR